MENKGVMVFISSDVRFGTPFSIEGNPVSSEFMIGEKHREETRSDRPAL